MIVQLVRYGSKLTYEQVLERFQERSDRYREVPGLLQKYYVSELAEVMIVLHEDKNPL